MCNLTGLMESRRWREWWPGTMTNTWLPASTCPHPTHPNDTGQPSPDMGPHLGQTNPKNNPPLGFWERFPLLLTNQEFKREHLSSWKAEVMGI